MKNKIKSLFEMASWLLKFLMIMIILSTTILIVSGNIERTILIDICYCILPIPYIIILYKNYKKDNINPFKKLSIYDVLKIITFSIGFNFIGTVFLNLITPLLPQTIVSDLINSTDRSLSGSSFFMVLLTTGLIGPITEEILFRYGCQRILKKGFSTKTAIIIQSLIFGIAHGNVIQNTYAFISGLFLGYMYEKSDENLLVPIICHAAINTSSVIISVLSINENLGLGILFLISSIITMLIKKFKKI